MASYGVHPVSTALFILGYALALPIASRMPTVVARRQRLALWGHQLGMLLAALGWLFRGQVLVAVAHAVWLVIVNLWFEVGRPSRRAATGQ